MTTSTTRPSRRRWRSEQSSNVITRRQLGALVALTLMWGVNWPMMKLSLRELTPMYFRAITMTGGAL